MQKHGCVGLTGSRKIGQEQNGQCRLMRTADFTGMKQGFEMGSEQNSRHTAEQKELSGPAGGSGNRRTAGTGSERARAGAVREGKASQNKRRKRESLLNNAFELFTQKGISDTTIADIAERAGVAKGTFYLYFKDKYDLRDRLVRHKAEQILEHAYVALQSARAKIRKDSSACPADTLTNRSDSSSPAGTSGSPADVSTYDTGSSQGPLDTLEDQVIFFVDDILNQLSENRILLRFIAKNLSWGLLKHDVENKSPLQEEPDFITSLKEYFHQSASRYRNPEVLLYMIVEFIGSTAYSSILNAEPLPFETLKPYLLESVRAIMRAQETGTPRPAAQPAAGDPV